MIDPAALDPLRNRPGGGEFHDQLLILVEPGIGHAASVSNGADRVPTLVFDEIDTGVGGRLGAVLGKNLAELTEHHQIICVTHLPKMASFARLQWVIRKQVERGRTRTTITPLDESDRVDELAAMLRGDSAAEGTRQEAPSMLLEHKPPDDEHAVPFQGPPATVPIQEIVMPMLVDVDEPRRREIPPCVPEPGVRPFVWGVWGLLTVTAFGFVARYGTNVPMWDDYHIVRPLIGARAVTLDWLWEQCNEHRIPVPKLILVFADRLAGDDVRAGMYLSVATFAALAAALIRLAERLPGGGRPSDAFFPLLLLSLGQATSFLWSFLFANVLPTALAIAFLIPIVARASWPGPGIAVMTGVGMVLLPLCGGTGLVFVPALALWLLGAAWGEVRSGRPGRARRALALVLSVVPGLTLTVYYFRGFRRGLHPESEGGLIAGVRAAVQFLTGGLGMPTALAWPWSAGMTLALVAIAVVLLGGTWVRRPEERPRVFGLIAFLAGVTALAAAVGWGRGWAGPLAGFQGRYVTMATPFWCWLAFVFRLYAPPALGGLVHNTLFATLCVLLWPNTQAGLEHGREVASRVDALTRDLDAGLPAFQIVKRYTPFLYPNQDELNRILPLLREARFGPFRSLRDSPTFRETSLPLRPASVSLLRWEGTTAHVTGVDPQITFALPQARYVAGIRIKYSHSNPQGAPARFQLAWKRRGQVGFPDGQRYANWNLPTGNGQETLVWVDDTLDRFQIQPDNQPCEFRIDQIVLLTSWYDSFGVEAQPASRFVGRAMTARDTPRASAPR